jgi:hypothetical protein
VIFTRPSHAAETLARLNGQLRRLVRLSRHKPGQEDATSVLLVGWPDGPEMLEIDDRGRPASYTYQRFHAIGSGKVHAYIASEA